LLLQLLLRQRSTALWRMFPGAAHSRSLAPEACLRVTQSPQREAVVLVHGLWMTGAVCALLARRLRSCGFAPLSFSYPSVRLTLAEAAHRLGRFVRERIAGRVHFVGHSLGGLVALELLARDPSIPVGRVVLLGSPCTSSLAAEQLVRSRPGRAVLGRGLPQWRAERGVEVARRVETAGIAGTLRFGVASLVVTLPKPNDGAVTVAETKLPGLRDHLVLPVTHSGLIISARVARQVCAFLTEGRFTHA
jgi:pimeloyl-ACP methyl ester carboxylesterase